MSAYAHPARRLPAASRYAAALRAAVACGALAACAAALPAAAYAANTASISASFRPDRLGANAAITFTMRLAGENHGIPEPLRHVVLELPAGLSINPRGVPVCATQRLVAHGAHGCPSSWRIGTGSSLAAVRLGADTANESTTDTVFRAPNEGGHPALVIIAQGVTPLIRRVVTTAALLPASPPYGEKLSMAIPAIPSIPTEPDASILRTTLTVGAATHSSAGAIRVPRSCPAGGFPFAATFAFAEGGNSEATTTASCP